MSSAEVLQSAIQAARAGRREEARALLIQLVETDPQNELAWVWLSGLVDSLEDRIIACENALTLNPGNEKIRAYLAELQRQRASAVPARPAEEAAHLLLEARRLAASREITSAIQAARRILQRYPDHKDTWLFLGSLSPDLHEKVEALEQACQLDPSDGEAARALKKAKHLRANPLSAARWLEQSGKLDEALGLYERLAASAKSSREFDHIYRQIIRIEGLQKEKIRYIAPGSSISRLTFSWPLLYGSLALIQMGINPFSHPAPYLWLGFPFVVLGSFLLALSEVRSRHAVWQRIFGEHGDGSTFARLVTATTGWFLVIAPHVLLLLDSLNRLRNFRIPPMPL